MDISVCYSVIKNNILNLLSDAVQYFCVNICRHELHIYNI